MKTRTKLELLRAMSTKRRESQKGFTLVEVLVVCGILAILFASLVPNLLAARARAGASAAVSEAVGIARACQAVIASGIGEDDFISPDGQTITCNGFAGTVSGAFVSRDWTGDIEAGDGILCPNLNNTPSADIGTLAPGGPITLAISIADNSISCS